MSKGITIVGLGPGMPDLLTVEAFHTLEAAGEVWVRTRRHPTVATLSGKAKVESFDDLYAAHDSFAALYQDIAAQVIALGRREQGVIYAVPGHPAIGEASVTQIRTVAAQEGLPLRIVEGLSFIEPVLAAVGVDALDCGLQVADATDLAARLYPSLDPDRPALVAQLYSRLVAGEVKLTLMAIYPDDHPTRLIRAAGTKEMHVVDLPLYEIDRQPWIDHLTSLFIPPRPGEHSLAAFADVIARLRAPDGCPWDREQTHRSLRTTLLEETHEVLSALDREDMSDLREELGDLLMQIVMHAQMASEGSVFNLSDVLADVRAKIVNRHPHVFGDVRVANSAEVIRNWEDIKADEAGKEDRRSRPFASIPPTLPALARAQKIVGKALRLGWDGDPLQDRWANALAPLTDRPTTAHEKVSASEALFGDFLLAVVQWAGQHNLDAESALRQSSNRLVEQASRARAYHQE